MGMYWLSIEFYLLSPLLSGRVTVGFAEGSSTRNHKTVHCLDYSVTIYSYKLSNTKTRLTDKKQVQQTVLRFQ